MSLLRKFKKVSSNSSCLDDVLDEIGGNFEVELRSIYQAIETEPGSLDYAYTAIPRHSAIVRKDNNTPLAVMSSKYGVVQYREAVSFLGDLMQKGATTIDYAAVTDEGARLHLMCATNFKVDLDAGDNVRCYFTVSTSHDGTGALSIACTPIHGATDTIFTPMGKGVVTMRHTKNVKERMLKVKATMNKVSTFFTEFTDTLKRLRAHKVNQEHAVIFVNMLVKGSKDNSKRAENIRNKILDIFNAGVVSQIPSCKGTLFGLLIAAQVYADNYKTVRKSSIRNEIDAEIEARLNGDAARLKAEAYATALKLEKM